jgi:predicted nuclease of predicted toxin-antitoxin system
MKLWLDAQLSPAMAPWIADTFQVETTPIRALGLRDATDHAIFQAARAANAVILTKDGDFALLLGRFGPPPRILWLRCGNTSNARLRQLLTATLAQALALLETGEPLVQISDSW